LPLERWIAKAGDGIAAVVDVDADGDRRTTPRRPGWASPAPRAAWTGALEFVDPA
jgi:hypothetical protein